MYTVDLTYSTGKNTSNSRREESVHNLLEQTTKKKEETKIYRHCEGGTLKLRRKSPSSFVTFAF